MDEDANKAPVHEMEEQMTKIPTVAWVVMIIAIPLAGIAVILFL